MSQDDPQPPRITVRHRTLKEAKVVLSDWTAIDCVLRDLSDTGARIEFGGSTDLPKEFRLLVVSTKTLFPAVCVWQRGLSAGLRFTGPGKAAPPRKW